MRRRRRPPKLLTTIPTGPGGGMGHVSVDRAGLEAFDALLEGVGRSRAVLVTGYGEKSRVALGLAAAALAGGRGTALVECDFARPTLAARLALDETPGLVEYLRRQATAPQILQPAVLAGPAGGRAPAPLVCVVAGSPTSHGPTLLGSDDFRHATAKLRSAYDLVVVDAPSLGDEQALIAALGEVDFSVAACAKGELPRHLWAHVDGLVATAE
jgi:Mrp family chromosome partitioning ATPase